MKFAAATLQYKWGQSKAVKIVAVPYELLISYSTKKERERAERRRAKCHSPVEISCVGPIFPIMGFIKLKTQGNDEMVLLVWNSG